MASDKEKINKKRLDVLLVEKGFVQTREKAQALILAGRILTGDKLLNKPCLKIDENTEIRIKGELDQYVSRGAYKLKGAIETFRVHLKDKICLDVGASTGGFTQICLENGATKVYSVDVGHNQLDWLLRKDPRVVSMEGVNMRLANETLLPEKVDFVCIDASFISLKLILEPTQKQMKTGAEIIALIKPQFEVGKENVGKGGIVQDAELHQEVIREISSYMEKIGFNVLGVIESSIKGQTGNKEFLIYAKL